MDRNPETPAFVAPQAFTDPDAAVAQVRRLYDAAVGFLREALADYVRTPLAPDTALTRVRATYPFVRVRTQRAMVPMRPGTGGRLSYGFVAGPGRYETTLTRPDLFADYWREQFRLLLDNHGAPLEIGLGSEPIPVHFALGEDAHFEGELDALHRARLGNGMLHGRHFFLKESSEMISADASSSASAFSSLSNAISAVVAMDASASADSGAWNCRPNLVLGSANAVMAANGITIFSGMPPKLSVTCNWCSSTLKSQN